MRQSFAWVVVGVVLMGVLVAPSGSAMPEEFFIFEPSPGGTILEKGDGLRVCAVQPLAAVPMFSDGVINVTKPSGVTLSQDPDDEDCVAFLMNETGRYDFFYPESETMTGDFLAERHAYLFVGDRVESFEQVGEVESASTVDFEVQDALLQTLLFGVFFIWALKHGLFFAAIVSVPSLIDPLLAPGVWHPFGFTFGVVLVVIALIVEFLARNTIWPRTDERDSFGG